MILHVLPFTTDCIDKSDSFYHMKQEVNHFYLLYIFNPALHVSCKRIYDYFIIYNIFNSKPNCSQHIHECNRNVNIILKPTYLPFVSSQIMNALFSFIILLHFHFNSFQECSKKNKRKRQISLEPRHKW